MFVDMTADIAHTLHPHRQLLVAFSGGLDSTVLLHQLVLLREQDPSLTLRAVHVHHGLSAHADDWVAHCRQICQQWQVPLVVHHVTLARGGLGVEAHARAARYQAFQDTLNAGEVLVTAQHQDDQCETLLLALKRGSGPTGLSAMAPSSAFAGSRLLRPLLNETRESLRQWALAHQLSWIEDESNQDDTYDRNFLRLRVIPVLRERWPHFSEAVARSASLCAEQEQLLDEMLAAELASLWGPMHGGANESSMRMLEEIESVDQVPAFLRQAKRDPQAFRRLGFGNSRYRHRDPRADILRETSHRVLAEVGMSDRLLQVAMALEDVALTDPYFVDNGLSPSVDFYTAVILKAMNLPSSMFAVVTAVGRTVGWVAHWNEMHQAPLTIYRPRQIYVGEGYRDYVSRRGERSTGPQ